jgi:hypothetical protein
MNNSEETIYKVLAGLRDAEAPPGLTRRIREAVEARALAKAGSKSRGWLPVWLPDLGRMAEGQSFRRIAFAGTIAVLLAIAVTRFGNGPKQQTRHSDSEGTRVSTGLLGVRQDATIHPNIQTVKAGARLSARSVRLTGEAVAVSRSAMLAVNHPAPEAPLTREEKLLLRVVNEGDPQQMAMLNPEIRAIEKAQSEAKFQEFVEQSIKGDRE